MWEIEIACPRATAEALGDMLSAVAAALSVGGLDDDDDGPAVLRILARDASHLAAVEAAVAVAATSLGIAAPSLAARLLPETDWVSAYEAGRPPLRAGRYLVHGGHVRDLPQSGAVCLRVDAGRAFGSGEHESTRGCLMALDRLARRARPTRVLDLGCGSGILGIAAARTFPATVIATDIDPVAAVVAAENARLNRVAARMRTASGAGLDAPAARRGAPYDLILANILARPLERLAPAVAGVLAPSGWLILSGLLDRQEAPVLSAYRAQRLALAFRVRLGAWVTLALAGAGRPTHLNTTKPS